MKPVFSVLAVLLALVGGAFQFAFQFKRHWTPLQCLYFSAYFQTAHLAQSLNRNLRPPRVSSLLLVAFPRGARLAVDADVSEPPAVAGEPVLPTQLILSPAARRAGATRLGWQPLRMDDESLHAWLAHAIYDDSSLWQLGRNAWYTALFLLAAMLPLAIRKDKADHRRRLLGKVLKGANVVTRSQFHRRAHHHSGVGFLTTESVSSWELLRMEKPERSVVRVARQNECEHFLIVGDTGTGKSSLIRQLLSQIANRNETAIVYDPAREYLPQFLNERRGDVVLNPLDARMPYWGPGDELLHPTEADALAKSLFPDRDHENRFFIESPRKIFAHLLKLRPTPQELCHWIAYADPEIDSRVAGTPLEALIAKDAPQQRNGVLGVLERAASTFSLLPSPERRRPWTATVWAEKRGGWIFLTSTPETRETLRPLISMWLDFLVLRLTAQTESRPSPAWVVADEVATLENLPSLPLALAESRKSNTRMVLGLQGRSQVEMRYGREAEAMLSQPRTKIFLRTGEPRAAEWISKCIGEIEIEHLREGRTSSDFGFQQSKNASVDSRIQSAILASEISNLENLHGYFQTPGFTLKLKFPYAASAKNQPSFVRGTAPETMLSVPTPAASTVQQLTLAGATAEVKPTPVRRRGRKRKPAGEDTSESRPMMQID
jgi:Type IV secretion-system coupling protein DNA-binding domain